MQQTPLPPPPLHQQLHQLKQSEAEAGATRPRPRRPRMLVLGPTKELVEQLTRVAKSLSHTAKFASTMLSSSGTKSDQKAALSAPLDVVFATPGRLLQHNEEGTLHLGDVKWVVVDEADTMILKVGALLACALLVRFAGGDEVWLFCGLRVAMEEGRGRSL